MLTFEDVTTRGSYYPDKSMATAAVSLSSFWDGNVLIEDVESTSLPSCHEYDQARP